MKHLLLKYLKQQDPRKVILLKQARYHSNPPVKKQEELPIDIPLKETIYIPPPSVKKEEQPKKAPSSSILSSIQKLFPEFLLNTETVSAIILVSPQEMAIPFFIKIAEAISNRFGKAIVIDSTTFKKENFKFKLLIASKTVSSLYSDLNPIVLESPEHYASHVIEKKSLWQSICNLLETT